MQDIALERYTDYTNIDFRMQLNTFNSLTDSMQTTGTQSARLDFLHRATQLIERAPVITAFVDEAKYIVDLTGIPDSLRANAEIFAKHRAVFDILFRGEIGN